MKPTNTLHEKIYDTFLYGIKNGDTELADDLLTALGYDVKEVNTMAEKIYKRQSFKIKAQIQKQKNDALLEKATSQLQQSIQKNEERPLAYIKEMVQQNRVQMNYRNLDKLSHHEIKQIIKDVNLVDLLDHLSEQEKE